RHNRTLHSFPTRRSSDLTGRIPKTQPYAFSADEGADVGVDNETMVSNDYKPGENKFTGKIISVTIDTKPSNLSAADDKAVEDAEDRKSTRLNSSHVSISY